MSRPVLIYCDRSQELGEVAELAQGLRRDGRFEPVVLLGKGLPPDAITRFESVRVHTAWLERGRALHRFVRYVAMMGTLVLGHLVMPRRPSYMVTRLRLRLRHAVVRRFVEAVAPAALIVTDDRINRYNLPLILMARGCRLPVIVVPWALSDPDMESDSRVRRGVVAAGEGDAGLPNNVRQAPSTGHAALFYPVDQARALAAAGLRYVDPWLVGGGDVDLLCAPSTADRDRLLREGLPADRLAVTGRPSSDAFHARRQQAPEVRRKLDAEHGFDPARRVVLALLPPYWEVGLLPREAHMAHIERLLDALQASGEQVVLSLHPRMDRDAYRWVEARSGLSVTARDTPDVLPAFDLLVSYESSVNHWAGILGIPVVMVRGTERSAGQLESAPGSVDCTTDELAAMLAGARVAPPDAAAREHFFGPLDGGCVRRIADRLAERTATMEAAA